EVAHLLAPPTPADVGELAPEVVPAHPEGEDALVDLAHLPRAGDDAAAVDDEAQAIHRAIFLDEQFGAELRRAIERPRALQREVLGDAALRYPGQVLPRT